MAVACPNMSIVVIVPYHNESKSIERTLDSIDSSNHEARFSYFS